MDPPKGKGSDALINAQINFEKRFSCPICLDPKLKMVVASCQHRTCSDCLYNKENKLHETMKKCPTCQRENVFPETRPDIPEDNIEMQRQLGITECPMDGCKAGLWMWDVEKHIESCPHAVVSPKPGTKRKQRSMSTQQNENTTPKTKRQKQAASSPAKNHAEDFPSTSRVTRSSFRQSRISSPRRHPPMTTPYHRRHLREQQQQQQQQYPHQQQQYPLQQQQYPHQAWNSFIPRMQFPRYPQQYLSQPCQGPAFY